MKLLSFCSGCGALDYGINSVIKAEIVLKCELDKKIQETIIHHNPDVILKDDIMQLSAESIRDECGLQPDDDIILLTTSCYLTLGLLKKKKNDFI